MNAKLTLAEAILKGAEKYPQAHNVMFRLSRKNHVVSACALGQAFIGCFGVPEGALSSNLACRVALEADFPNLLERRVQCPEMGCYDNLSSYMLETQIVHLNDIHKWTPQQIADWVATVESEAQP